MAFEWSAKMSWGLSYTEHVCKGVCACVGTLCEASWKWRRRISLGGGKKLVACSVLNDWCSMVDNSNKNYTFSHEHAEISIWKVWILCETTFNFSGLLRNKPGIFGWLLKIYKDPYVLKSDRESKDQDPKTGDARQEVREQRLSNISLALLHICSRLALLTLARIAWYERAVFRRLFTAPQLRTVQIDMMPK